ncbi:MAG: hypothetical protein AB7Q00_08360 [Phycisphaerales bacterium]
MHTPNIRTLLLIAMVVLASTLGACQSQPRVDPTLLRIVPLNEGIDARIGLDVEVRNLRGIVQVVEVPGSVEALVRVRGYGRTGESRPGEAVILLREGRPTLNIEARGSPLDPTPTQILVEIPKVQGVRVVNSGGSVYVYGGAGPIAVTNDVYGTIRADGSGGTGGDVRVYLTRGVVGDISILNGVGDVSLTLPSSSSLAFDVETLEGRVEVNSEIKPSRVVSTGNSWHGVTHLGEANALIRTTRGEARVSLLREVRMPQPMLR